MRPDLDDLDDEIRGHMAISVKERIERGEDPEAARLAALQGIRQRHAHPRLDARRLAPSLVRRRRGAGRDMRFALRSLLRAKGLAATVVVTLALGIGANAAIFSVVRGVLLRPLVNRDEDRLIYIRQSAPGLGAENMTFSVPEVNDFRRGPPTIGSLRRLLHRRLHDDRPWRRAAHGEGGRRRRVVLRRHGPAPGARPPAERRATMARTRRARPSSPTGSGPPRSTATRPSSARSSASVRAPPPWSACSSRRSPIRPTPRSSRTS